MAARSPSFGIAHPTVVPTNYDPADDADRGDEQAQSDGES